MKKFLFILIILILAGCVSNKKKEPEKPLNQPPADTTSTLEITPLLPAGVAALLDESTVAQQQGNNQKAIELLYRALSIAGNAPTVLQYLAEAYLVSGDFKQARGWAQKAVDNGPKKGDLCKKSRRTLAIAAEQLGLSDLQFRALQAIESCNHEPIKRY